MEFLKALKGHHGPGPPAHAAARAARYSAASTIALESAELRLVLAVGGEIIFMPPAVCFVWGSTTETDRAS
jgi:hypothetical protein